MNDRPESQPPSTPVESPVSVVSAAPLVNAIAMKDCIVRSGDGAARVLDISHLRVVIEAAEPWLSQPENEPLTADFTLDRSRFTATVTCRGRGPADAATWLRLSFERILPSARSSLRAFLSPKKVGESLIEDQRSERWRHYHGLNESELWFDPDGGILFTYLDGSDAESPKPGQSAQPYQGAQFVIQLRDTRGPLRVGKLLRQDYMELKSADAEIPLLPLSDREAYAKLGECRDIVTNFRPSAPAEYGLKQRLLRSISETLYSTSHKVDMASARPSSAPASSASSEN